MLLIKKPRKITFYERWCVGVVFCFDACRPCRRLYHAVICCNVLCYSLAIKPLWYFTRARSSTCSVYYCLWSDRSKSSSIQLFLRVRECITHSKLAKNALWITTFFSAHTHTTYTGKSKRFPPPQDQPEDLSVKRKGATKQQQQQQQHQQQQPAKQELLCTKDKSLNITTGSCASTRWCVCFK